MIGDVLQPTHLIFILVVALLVLGPKRLPEVGKSLGKGIRDFRGALSGIDEPTPSGSSQTASPPPVTPATTVLPAGAPAVSAPLSSDVSPATDSVADAVEVHETIPATAPGSEGSSPSQDAGAATHAEQSVPAEQHPVASAPQRISES